MATTLSQAKSQRMYSWWWDSHISPKNSRWLQENLTDMDSKVKSMIKLIEEDADSFARRAEMYYKKRPELMKLVEEFYRAYRALAERYDHATGALRQAHRTMSEAFPNQIPMVLPDDAPANSGLETDPQTPVMSTPARAFFAPDDHVTRLSLPESRTAKRSGAFTEESNSEKQMNGVFGSGNHARSAEGRVRKCLNFHETVESEQVSKFEKEILDLKEALAKLEAEKEAALNQYQQSLENLSKLEAAVSHAQKDFGELNEKASKAEAETQTLKEALSSLEAEKEANLLQYQVCLEKISDLENSLSHVQKDSEVHGKRANKAENEAQALKEDLAVVESEKDGLLNKYKQSLEVTSDLENKLVITDESARRYRECAQTAEGEVETLKLAISKLSEEKDAVAHQYQQCLETISSLELRISAANEEIERLNSEIDGGVKKLICTEERCSLLEKSNQSLHSELETMVLKMGTQSQELTEKQKELGRLWTSIQEEHLRFVEAETAFQTLQLLHSQAQDELRSLASELQKGTQTLREMETHNEGLQDEILKIKEENRSLNEQNLSSTMSMNDMQQEIICLREMNGKLVEEVELRVDQRNALQQEIYCMKEELKDLNSKHHAFLKQMDALDLHPESFETSVKELQNDNSDLRDLYQKERSEKVALLEKLEIFEKLLEKNVLLENSLSDLGAELEAVRGKVIVLEESYRSLLQEKVTLVDEKATLMTQMQSTTENLAKLSETNTILEDSLSNAHEDLEVLKSKAKSLEDSCLLLVNQKSSLVSEKDTLVSEIEITRQSLMDLEKRFIELEEKYSLLEREKNFTLGEVEELKVYLEAEKQEHASFAQTKATELTSLETQVYLLKEEVWSKNRKLEGELDKSLNSQMENFVLQRSVQALQEKNSYLLIDYQKLLAASKLSEKLISQLEQENLEQQMEVKSLFDQRQTLRVGMNQLLKVFDIPDHGYEDIDGQDKLYVDNMMIKFQDIKSSLSEAQDEKELLALEISVLLVLLGQLRLEAASMVMAKSLTDQELQIRSEQCLMVQSEAHKLFEMNEVLKQEHASFAQTKATELTSLETQFHLLKEEIWSKNRELEGELDKSLNSQMENFVLQKSVQDLQEKNSYLLVDYQKLLAASKLSEKLISELEQENIDQQMEVKSMLDQRQTLRVGMSQLLKLFDIPDHGCEDIDGQDKLYVDNMMIKFQDIKSSLSEAQDEKELLALEISVLIVLLGQLRSEAASIVIAKSLTDQELQIRSEQCLMVQSEAHKLFEINEVLKLKVNDGCQKEEKLVTQIVDLRGRLLDTEGAYEISQEEKRQVLEEKKILFEQNLQMEETSRSVEEENCTIYSEMLSSNLLSMMFKSFLDERSMEMKEICEDLNKVNVAHASLEEKLSIKETKLEDQKMENLHLKETLQKAEDELQAVTFAVGQLSLEIENGKNLFQQKKMEHLEAEQKIVIKEDEISGLSKIVEDLKSKNDAIQMIREDQEKQILELGGKCDQLNKENKCLGEACQNMEVELHSLQDKHALTKNREESLCSELQKRKDEIDLLETETTVLYGEFQTSTIAQTLFQQKVDELLEECNSLREGNNSKEMKIELLDKRVSILECQNEELQDQLALYGPAVTSLVESISSMEKCTFLHTSLNKTSNEELKETELANQHVESYPSEDHAMVPASLVNMQHFQVRVKYIEDAIIEMERLATQENINAHTKLESAMGQIKELTTENRLLREKFKPTSEISEETGLLPKDIMLDHVSESSSHGISRRHYIGPDNQMLELWETTDQDSSIDLTVGKGKKIVSSPTRTEHPESVKQKREYSSSDILVEKELEVDNFAISKRFTEPHQEGNKKKVLERLDSDIQKLTNLQITVQDLKTKVENVEKSRKGKAITETDTMKGRLNEAEKAIQKLFDFNGKLTKNIEDNSSHFGKKSAMESEESQNVRRRRISEQARGVSEKIGQLQLEIQRIQFDLLKLADEKERRGKMRIIESKKTVLLRDYLYGGARKIPRKTKAPFCACVNPSTRGD